jgi:prevent-host-death family protein
VIAHKSTWQLQEAKNKLSEVIRRAREEGPQTITVRGENAVVVLQAEMYGEYLQSGRPKESLAKFFERWRKILGPNALDLSSPPEDPPRDVDLPD